MEDDPASVPLRLDASRALLERARKVEALVAARPGLFFMGGERIGGYPLFASRARGPHVWDVDGNRYLDYLLGYGSVILGHADEAVRAAVARAGEDFGGNPSLASAAQIDLAEKMVGLCPNVDSVTFLKTGSDAVGAAVRLARAITGRPYVLRWGMNGWHDWCAPVREGVPEAVSRFTIMLDRDDPEQARRLFATHGGRIACVVTTPYEVEPPPPGYLRDLADLSREHGALFVLDEVRSGFRVALGGAQELFGVDADLVAYGKAMANGYAISALGGRRALMERILSVGLTVTYFRLPDAIAAANATLDRIVALDAPAMIAALGRALMAGLDEAARAAGVEARATGLPCTPCLVFEAPSPAVANRKLRMFCNLMLESGVIIPPNHHWFLCAALRREDVDETVEKAHAALERVARAF